MQNQIRWTEDELAHEITRLDEMIGRASRADDQRARCVVSYLQQVLRDRRDTLTVLRLRRRRTH